MRPIDADRLLETIANLDVECADQKRASIMFNTIRKVFPKIVNDEPTIEAEPVKHNQQIDPEKLIGIFGTLCDHMVDNGRCDVICPYAKTKDEDDECEAWKTIQKIRGTT